MTNVSVSAPVMIGCFCGPIILAVRPLVTVFHWKSTLLYLLYSQSVCLGVQHPCGTFDFLSVCCCLFLWGALSDERTGLQFAVQSFNGPSRTKPVTILYCLIWDSNLEGRFPYLYPQEQGGPVIPPGIRVPLRRLLRLVGQKVDVRVF
jgi:hypothetical protein